MNVSLKFVQQLPAYVRQEFEQLVASIREGWQKQHNIDGTHQGATGTFTTVDSKTVTVVNGLITSIV
jgi:hypothetical protein